MRNWKLWLCLIVVMGLCGLGLSACSPAQSELSGNAPQKEEAAQPATAVAQVTAEVTLTATQAPTEPPAPTEAATAELVNYCVDCHTDKEQLIDTAAPQEVVVKESEGTG